MKTFKTLAMIKHPRPLVWTTIRDRLSDMVPMLTDVAGITVQAREDSRDGTVRLVNLWQAQAPIPASLASVITPEMLAWTDRAEWRPQNWECHWQIQPHFFSDRIHCAGVTHYEEAMAGRGTRLTFEGSLEVTASNIPGLSGLIETFAIGLIPKNFQKLAYAVGQHLEGESATS